MNKGGPDGRCLQTASYMDAASEISKLMDQSGDEPTGIVVRSASGKLFFLTDEDAARTAIPASKAYETFRQRRGTGKRPPGGPKPLLNCDSILSWLDSHSPNTKAWRRLSITWANNCL